MARTRTAKTCVFCSASDLFWKKNPAGVVHLHNADGTQHGGPGGTCPSWGKKHDALVQPIPAPAPRVYGIDDVINIPDPPAIAPAPKPAPAPVPAPDAAIGDDASRALFNLIEPHLSQRIKDELVHFTPNAPAIVHDVQLWNGEEKGEVLAGTHASMADLLELASMRHLADGDRPGMLQHVLVVGPAGSGKTYCARKVADALNLKFYPFAVGPTTSEAKLLGYTNMTTGEYVRTPFRDWVEFGGLFLFDEMDSGNAECMLIVNQPLSGNPLLFPDGAVLYPHADCLCIGSANTYGHGADRLYVGRNELDAATLDRFVGIDWDYDSSMEAKFANGQQEFMDTVIKLRHAAARLEIRAVFGSRKIQQGARYLERGMSWERVCKHVLWFGVSADDKAKLISATNIRVR